MTPPPSGRLPSRALLAGQSRLWLRYVLFSRHSDSRGGGGYVRFGGLSGTWWFYAEISLQTVGQAGEARRWAGGVLLVTLALALVAEELAGPHAQEAFGAGVGANGQGCVGVGAGQGRGLHQEGRRRVVLLTAVHGAGQGGE